MASPAPLTEPRRVDGDEDEPGTAEILSAVRRIQLRTRKAVTDMIAGGFQSVFRGSGMEFEEVREYVPGDDVRTIDWNVTARTGRPYIKKFVEEREQTIVLGVDFSASMRFGSADRSMRATAAELAAILAFSAVQAGDRVGLLGFTDRVECELPPRGDTRTAFRITREALVHPAEGQGTSVAAACKHLGAVLKRQAYVFLISDFLTDDFKLPLGMLARRHDVVALRLVDRRRRDLPSAGLVRWLDPETGRELLVDSSSKAVRDELRRRHDAQGDALRATLGSQGVDLVDIPVVEVDELDDSSKRASVVEPLIAFLHMRERRR